MKTASNGRNGQKKIKSLDSIEAYFLLFHSGMQRVQPPVLVNSDVNAEAQSSSCQRANTQALQV